jgi:hypothetical protein
MYAAIPEEPQNPALPCVFFRAKEPPVKEAQSAIYSSVC